MGIVLGGKGFRFLEFRNLFLHGLVLPIFKLLFWLHFTR